MRVYVDVAGDRRGVGLLVQHHHCAAGRECWRWSAGVVARRSFYPGLRPRGGIHRVDGGCRLCEPFSQVDGSGSIGLAESGDERGLHGDDFGEEGVYEGLALVGEMDQQLSSIGGMWLTSDEAPSLEGVEKAGHGAGCDHEAARDDRGGQRTASPLDDGERLGGRVR
jgi:hypothetical protein